MLTGDWFSLSYYVQNDYLRAMLVLAVLLILIKICVSVLGKFLLRMTSKTKTELDDILFQKSSKPVTMIAFFIALRLAIGELVLEEVLKTNIEKGIYSALIIAIGWFVYVLVEVLVINGWKRVSARSRIKINESLTSLMHEVLRVTMILLILLYLLDIWGVKIMPLLGALGIAGIAVALALQPVLSNVFSGVSMILDKSVRVGDWVVLEDKTWGIVEKIGIRSTKIRTFDNEMLVMPNSKFAESRIQNVSMPEPTSRIVISFGAAYGSDIEKVKKIVLGEIKKVEHIINAPEPSVQFLEMGESSLNFKAFFYIDTFKNRMGAIDEANTRIYNALNRAGISIPFPQMDVHLKR